MMDEVRLPGGNVGGAVRVGETVRRPAGRWTPTIQRVLGQLAESGIEAVPRPLGVDDRGREVVSYIDGETVGDEDRWPGWARSDATVVEVARLLRRVHDATRGFAEGERLPWRLGDGAVGAGEVVCHNDVAPYNLVWRRDQGVVGLIDWDFASPDDPRSDVAYCLWQFAPLHHPDLSQKLGWDDDVDRLARMHAFGDAYGLDERSGLTTFVTDRMKGQAATITRLASEGHAAFRHHIDRGDLEDIERSIAYVGARADDLERALAR